MAKEEHTACLQMPRGNRAKFKQNLSVTGTLQPVGPHWCAFVTLLDDRGGGEGGDGNQPKTKTLFWGDIFS